MGARVGIVPPNLLSVGVVETHRPAPEPVVTETIPDLPQTGEDALADITEAETKPRSTRKRSTRGRKAGRADEEAEKPAAKRARKSRSKTISE